MLQEVKFQLEAALPIRNRGGDEPSRGDIQRDMPGVIEPWRLGEPDLADYLGPQMQGGVGVLPRRIRQLRPEWFTHRGGDDGGSREGRDEPASNRHYSGHHSPA